LAFEDVMNIKTKLGAGVILFILILGIIFAIPTGLTSLAGSAAIAVVFILGILLKRVVF
jgi:hypothetical protein